MSFSEELAKMQTRLDEIKNSATRTEEKDFQGKLKDWLHSNAVIIHRVSACVSPEDDLEKFVELCLVGSTSKAEKPKAKKVRKNRKPKKADNHDTNIAAKDESVKTKISKKSGRPKKVLSEKEIEEKCVTAAKKIFKKVLREVRSHAASKRKADRESRREAREKRREIAASKPKRVPCAYMLWLNDAREEIVEDIGTRNGATVCSEAARRWKSFDQSFRDEWNAYRLDLVEEMVQQHALNFDEEGAGASDTSSNGTSPLVDYESEEEC